MLPSSPQHGPGRPLSQQVWATPREILAPNILVQSSWPTFSFLGVFAEPRGCWVLERKERKPCLPERAATPGRWQGTGLGAAARSQARRPLGGKAEGRPSQVGASRSRSRPSRAGWGSAVGGGLILPGDPTHARTRQSKNRKQPSLALGPSRIRSDLGERCCSPANSQAPTEPVLGHKVGEGEQGPGDEAPALPLRSCVSLGQ